MSSDSAPMAEPSPVKFGGLTEAMMIFSDLFSVAVGLHLLAVIILHARRRVRYWHFELDDGLVPLIGAFSTLWMYVVTEWAQGATFAIGTPAWMLAMSMQASAMQSFCWIAGIYMFAPVLSRTSVRSTLPRINKETDHRKMTLLVLLLLSMVAFVARNFVGLVAFLLYDLAGRKDTIKIIDNAYRVAISIYVLVDIMLAVAPVLIIRTLSVKSTVKLSKRAILAMGSIACLAALLIVPVELDHPGTMDEFVNDWFFDIGSVFLWKEMVDGLSLIFMLYPDDLETLLQF